MVPWDQTPQYLAATNTAIPPGHPTTYVVPRRTGNSPTDVIAFHPAQAYLSFHNLPDILYELWAPQSWWTFKNSGLPPQKCDAAGNGMYEHLPEAGKARRPLLDFPVLVDKIGTAEEWWYFVFEETSSEEEDTLFDEERDTAGDEYGMASDYEPLDEDAGSSVANASDQLIGDEFDYSSSDKTISDVEENAELAEESNGGGSDGEITSSPEAVGGSETNEEDEHDSSFSAGGSETIHHAELEAEVEEIMREHEETGHSIADAWREETPE
ncbi:MAG: hypothetical protein Q9187_004389 [Circinaria calcarea]